MEEREAAVHLDGWKTLEGVQKPSANMTPGLTSPADGAVGCISKLVSQDTP